MTARRTKTEVILANKRASNRLRPVAKTLLEIAQGRIAQERIAKEKRLIAARLDRELTDQDEGEVAVREAVAAFWFAQEQGADAEQLIASAEVVYIQVRAVQTARWQAIEDQYGSIQHYFDEWGQIKPRYRQQATKEQPQTERTQHANPINPSRFARFWHWFKGLVYRLWSH